MSRHLEIGRRGEDLAADWLVHHGFAILHRNWRHGRYEVDCIAGRDNVVEVAPGSPPYVVVPYVEEMQYAYAAADGFTTGGR